MLILLRDLAVVQSVAVRRTQSNGRDEKGFGMSAGAGNAPNAIAIIGPSLTRTSPETKSRLRQ
jgi:hypothetical protein